MIECEKCHNWFHWTCVDLNQEKVSKIDKYYCENCFDDKEFKTSYKLEINPVSYSMPLKMRTKMVTFQGPEPVKQEEKSKDDDYVHLSDSDKEGDYIQPKRDKRTKTEIKEVQKKGKRPYVKKKLYCTISIFSVLTGSFLASFSFRFSSFTFFFL